MADVERGHAHIMVPRLHFRYHHGPPTTTSSVPALRLLWDLRHLLSCDPIEHPSILEAAQD